MGPTPLYGASAETPSPPKKADFAMKQTNICRLSGDITTVLYARRRCDSTVDLRRVGVGGMWTKFATSSRRLLTDSVDNLETDHTDSIAVWLCKFWSILITFFQQWRHYVATCQVVTTSIAQQHKLGHSRVPTGAFTPPTRLNSTVESRRRRRCVLGLTEWTTICILFLSLCNYFLPWSSDNSKKLIYY